MKGGASWTSTFDIHNLVFCLGALDRDFHILHPRQGVGGGELV